MNDPIQQAALGPHEEPTVRAHCPRCREEIRLGGTHTCTEVTFEPQAHDDCNCDERAKRSGYHLIGCPCFCPKSQRVDRPSEHSWKWDGDDPYVTCAYCGQRRDAHTGRVINYDQRVPVPESSLPTTQNGRGWRIESGAVVLDTSDVTDVVLEYDDLILMVAALARVTR